MRALMTWFLLQADPYHYKGGHSEPLEFCATIVLCLVVWFLLMRPLFKDDYQPQLE